MNKYKNLSSICKQPPWQWKQNLSKSYKKLANFIVQNTMLDDLLTTSAWRMTNFVCQFYSMVLSVHETDSMSST